MERQRSREERRSFAMSPSTPQPDYASPIIQELFEWVQNHCINGTNGPSATPNRPFMPLDELQAYLKAEDRATKLLHALYPERDDLPLLVEALEHWYIRVFIILTLIGKGRYIKTFAQHTNLKDPHLPFLEKPAHFPIDPTDDKFWEKFYEKQFAFCAHVFRYNDNRLKLEDLCILPIISKEVLGQGGSAAIYKIKLHPYYDQLNPAPRTSSTHPIRPANTYVLKTYNTKDASMYFENEVDAFTKLATKDDPSLIQFLGSYRQGNTYNILLEYADRGTLEDYFQRVAPPSLGKDIVMFWERLFKVTQALSRIHKTERRDSFRGPDILIGWHQDVKPSNILVLSGKSGYPYDVDFKLADLGLSHFKRTVILDRKIADGDVGGTKDYGAPECHRSDEFLEQSKFNVRPLVDIWSFGGICSEAAVWVVLGMSGLNIYRTQRREEICSRNTSQDGSCFHDGERLLQTVEDMHDRLRDRGEIRPGDHVTSAVLEHMVFHMLQMDPEDRHDAIWHWSWSQKILKKAQSKLEESNRQTTPTHGEPMANNARFFGTNLPETPPRTSHSAAQPDEGSFHAHGPPPHLYHNSSDPQTPGRSSSLKGTPKRRSDTWHESATRPDLAVGPVHGSLSPPIPSRQPFGASPPLDKCTLVQEQTENLTANFDKMVIGTGETSWRSGNRLSYSPPNASEGANSPSTAPISPQGIQGFLPPEAHSGARLRPDQQEEWDAGTFPLVLPNNSAFGPPLEPPPQHSGATHIPNRFGTSSPMINIPSNNESQPSNTSPLPPMANTTAAEPPPRKPKQEKPSLSYKDAKRIREMRGSLKTEHQSLLNYLKKRDHVFLIDDSLSMRDHWDDVVSLFSVFAYFAKKYDKNGLEMYFTVSEDKEHFDKTTPAVSHLKYMTQKSPSIIDIRLSEILRDYQSRLDRQNGRKGSRWSLSDPVKQLSLYVFTDGAWPGCDAVAPVVAMVEKLQELKLPKQQVGIQFVRFGNDPVGIRRLEYLDSGLREKYTKDWDIVDTEPFPDGNLLKMFLGAISDWFDDD